MQNFNTNQARYLYVAGAIDSNVDTNLDIALGQAASGELFFKYKNVEGQAVRSDLINPNKIVSLKLTKKDKLALPIKPLIISIDSTDFTLSEFVGKTLTCDIAVRQFGSYDDADSVNVVASVIGNSTNTASAAAFYKDMAQAIVDSMRNFADVPFKVYLVKKAATSTSELIVKGGTPSTSDATCIVIIPEPTKFVRGKLSKEVFALDASFKAHKGEDVICWGRLKDGAGDAYATVAALNTAYSFSTALAPATISGAYALADLEYFCAGEDGDVYRGNNWPNNYEFVPAIDLSKEYNVISIEYYWNGDAENVVKSPRLIQIAAPATVSDDICETLFASIKAKVPADRLAAVEATLNTATTGVVAKVADHETRISALESD